MWRHRDVKNSPADAILLASKCECMDVKTQFCCGFSTFPGGYLQCVQHLFPRSLGKYLCVWLISRCFFKGQRHDFNDGFHEFIDHSILRFDAIVFKRHGTWVLVSFFCAQKSFSSVCSLT